VRLFHAANKTILYYICHKYFCTCNLLDVWKSVASLRVVSFRMPNKVFRSDISILITEEETDDYLKMAAVNYSQVTVLCLVSWKSTLDWLHEEFMILLLELFFSHFMCCL